MVNDVAQRNTTLALIRGLPPPSCSVKKNTVIPEERVVIVTRHTLHQRQVLCVVARVNFAGVERHHCATGDRAAGEQTEARTLHAGALHHNTSIHERSFSRGCGSGLVLH